MFIAKYSSFMVSIFAHIRRRVKKGENKGKVFYVCPKPRADQCGFFIFKSKRYVDILELDNNTSKDNDCW